MGSLLTTCKNMVIAKYYFSLQKHAGTLHASKKCWFESSLIRLINRAFADSTDDSIS